MKTQMRAGTTAKKTGKGTIAKSATAKKSASKKSAAKSGSRDQKTTSKKTRTSPVIEEQIHNKPTVRISKPARDARTGKPITNR